MATSTLIQSLNPGSADASHRREVETFLATSAIVAGDAVSFDGAQANDGDKTLYVVPLHSATPTARFFVGVALASASAGQRVDVCVAGLAEANVATGLVSGVTVEMSATAGRLAAYVNTSVNEICGRTASVEAGNKALVMIKKQF